MTLRSRSSRLLRALLLGQSALQESEAREKRALLRPANNRAPWSPEEVAVLKEQFGLGMGIPAIALEHGRSERAIATRLMQLGLIDASDPAVSPIAR